jgi:hypothetical protein
MGMGGDSTLSGQSFWLKIQKGLCNDISKGPCTVLAGRVGVVWADGREATPANGSFNVHSSLKDNVETLTGLKASTSITSCLLITPKKKFPGSLTATLQIAHHKTSLRLLEVPHSLVRVRTVRLLVSTRKGRRMKLTQNARKWPFTLNPTAPTLTVTILARKMHSQLGPRL